jgi:nucleotide-binding universal stress UspA family protein
MIMITLRSILCPISLSAESDEALRYAVALAQAYDARLFVLYCVESSAPVKGKDEETLKNLFEQALLCHLGLAELGTLQWQGLVVRNCRDVGESIVAEARRRGVDLIVMRSRRRPTSAMLLGSTAETVSRTAACPVLVTHPSEREWVGLSTGEIDLRRVLVAYDFSTDSEVALAHGLSLAQEYQAELHLLHVIPRAEAGDLKAAWSGNEGIYEGAACRLQRAIPREVYLWCNVVSSIRWGRVFQEVLAYAAEHKIDLICMGTSGRDFGMGSLFGSNVDRVLRQAPCPVLVARPLKPAVQLEETRQDLVAGSSRHLSQSGEQHDAQISNRP